MKRNLKERLFDENLFVEKDNEVRLRGSECPRCGRRFFPPKARCSECLRSGSKPVALDTRGTLYSYTTVFIPSKNFKPPYTVGYVVLNDGVQIFSQIRTGEGRALKIGSEVKMVIDDLWKGPDGENVAGYLFEPVND